jgi:CRP-like cAMP-binding protein
MTRACGPTECVLVSIRVALRCRFRFQKEDIVVGQGQCFQRIFQIVKGECRIEKTINNERVSSGRIGDGEIFGEMSFVLGGGAKASV